MVWCLRPPLHVRFFARSVTNSQKAINRTHSRNSQALAKKEAYLNGRRLPRGVEQVDSMLCKECASLLLRPCCRILKRISRDSIILREMPLCCKSIPTSLSEKVKKAAVWKRLEVQKVGRKGRPVSIAGPYHDRHRPVEAPTGFGSYSAWIKDGL